MSTRPERVIELARVALELSEHERREFVARQCADDARLGSQLDQILFICRAAQAEPGTLAAETNESAHDATVSTIGLDAGSSDTQPSLTLPPASQAVKEPEPTERSAGPRIIAGYEVLSTLGQGGMGIVYKARQLKLNRIVALKTIRSGQLADDNDVRRFQAEAEAAARLDHPGIVPVFEAGEHSGRHYFTMGFVDGGSLSQHVGGRPIEGSEAARICEAVGRAVQYAHDKGVLHRDLKPANILLDTALTPRVSDFGLAKLTATQSGLTMTGQIMGTPSFMAPEQAAGRAVDERADVYSLGAILYVCLTGRPPFEAASTLETLRQVQQADPVSPRLMNPAIALDLEIICLKCLEKEPPRRYQTAGEVADELARFSAGQAIHARAPGRLERAARWSRRHPREAVLVSALFTFLLVTSIGSAIAALAINNARSDAWIARDDAENSAAAAIVARDDASRKEQEARDAEREAQLLLSENSVQTARLASQRGQWSFALENLNRALQMGHPDVVDVRLRRLEAYEALNDVASSHLEIEWLSEQKNLGPHQGAVSLWQADLALPRGEQQRAVELVRKAQSTGLGEADSAYAQGLLAETTPQAITQLEKALEQDPFHHRALKLLTFLLLLSGRHDEAIQRLETAALLFPDDLNFDVLHVASLAARGQQQEANKQLEALRDRLGKDYATLKTIMNALDMAAQSTENWDNVRPSLATAQQYLKFSLSLQQVFLRGQSGDVSPLALGLTPAVTKTVEPLQQAVVSYINPLALHREVRVAKLLGQACAHHPEGTMYFLQAELYVGEEQWAEAEQSAMLAIRTPALVPGFNREACFLAAMSQAAQAALEGKTEKYSLAVESVRERLKYGNVSTLHAHYMRKIAESAGDLELAREISDMLLRDAPQNAQFLADRARLESKSGNPLAAIEFADRSLAIENNHQEAGPIRAASIQKLQEIVANLAAQP